MENNDDTATSDQLGDFGSRDSFNFVGTPVPQVFTLGDFEERQSQLSAIMEREIYPRLVTFHSVTAPRSDKPSGFTPEEVAEFAALTTGPDPAGAETYFKRMQLRGHSLDSLFEHFLAPTARYLGELWREDLCDFVHVTIGVARLQQLMAMFGAAAELPIADLRRRILLTSVSNEQHLFGLDLVARTMGAAGWDTHLATRQTNTNLISLIEQEWFGVVGMTIGTQLSFPQAARLISSIRRASLNEKISIMVGGPAFHEDRDSAVAIGADAVADDSIGAVVLAKKLLLSQLEGWR
jgi:methanogenic corrinoid protein MtbC1